MGGRGGKSKSSGGGGSATAAGTGGSATTETTAAFQQAVQKPGEEAPASAEEIYNTTGLSPEESRAAYDGILAFTGMAYGPFREYERTGAGDAYTKRSVEAINKYLDRAPLYDGELFRGFAFEDRNKFDAFMKSISSKNMELNAMSSFSKNPMIAEGFAEGYGGAEYQVVMRVRKSKPVGADISNISSVPYEEEVLVKKGTRFKIENIKKAVQDDGVIRVDITASH